MEIVTRARQRGVPRVHHRFCARFMLGRSAYLHLTAARGVRLWWLGFGLTRLKQLYAAHAAAVQRVPRRLGRDARPGSRLTARSASTPQLRVGGTRGGREPLRAVAPAAALYARDWHGHFRLRLHEDGSVEDPVLL